MSDKRGFPKLLTVAEAASRLHVSQASLIKWGRQCDNCLTILERRVRTRVMRYVIESNLYDYVEENTARFATR